MKTGLVHACRIFNLNRVGFRIPHSDSERDFYVIEAPDWINIIPLTKDNRVAMVRQYRCGIEEFTLEIPGGMCDPGEEPLESARREMLEESGFDSDHIESLGWVHPNPAIQNNRCHTFLARDAYKAANPNPDEDELFEQVLVPLDDIPGLIADGTITHSLVIAAFHLLGLPK